MYYFVMLLTIWTKYLVLYARIEGGAYEKLVILPVLAFINQA